MEKRELVNLFMEAHSILEDLQDCHAGSVTDDEARIAAAVAALIINAMKEDK